MIFEICIIFYHNYNFIQIQHDGHDNILWDWIIWKQFNLYELQKIVENKRLKSEGT